MPSGQPTTSPSSSYHNTPQCHSHALFLHSLPAGLLFFVPLFFALLSAVLTQCIRHITPGVGDKPFIILPTTTTTTADLPPDIENQAVSSSNTDATHPLSDAEAVREEDAPPPYVPPNDTPAAAAVPEVKAKPNTWVKLPSATLFVLGTSLFITLLFILLCLFLSAQWMTYCLGPTPMSVTGQVFCWLFVAGFAIWSTFAISCWAMLVRDLWGPKMRKKYPFGEGAIVFAVVVGVGCVVAVPFTLLGMGCIECVKRCQRRCCADALDDEEEGDGNEEGVEIGELRRRENMTDGSERSGVETEFELGGDGSESEGLVEEEEDHGEDVALIKRREQ